MSAAFELIDGIPNYNLYVGGKWVRSSRNEAVESRNPATGELFAKVQQAGAAETELAISAAHGAYKAWAATPVSAREAIFFRAADVLAAKTNEIVDVLIQESGSIAGKAGFEVGYCFDLLRPPPRRCEGRRAKRCRSRRPASLVLPSASRSA
jgi:vanillin dehydrogenase